MAETTHQEYLSDVIVERLTKLHRGDQVTFKRCLGRLFAQCPEATGTFYAMIPPKYSNLKVRTENLCFLVATLFFHIPHNPKAGNLGETCRKWAAVCPDSADRITRHLMDILSAKDENDLTVHLSSLVNHIRGTEGISINYARLINDLLRWNEAWQLTTRDVETNRRTVQRNWTRSFYGMGLGERE